jgi:hypothetical protein
MAQTASSKLNKCWAACLGDCSDKISGEHIVTAEGDRQDVFQYLVMDGAAGGAPFGVWFLRGVA